MNITKEALESAGYQKIFDPLNDGNLWSRGTYQKTVRGGGEDDEGYKLYAIAVNLFSIPRDILPLRASVTVQMSVKAATKGVHTVDIAMHLGVDTTIEEMEYFYHDTFVRLGGVPDVH